MNWNHIAPFNEPCETAPGWPVEKYTMKYVVVNGFCEECENNFSRTVSCGNATRVNTCGSRECKAARQRRIYRNKRKAA